MPMLIWLPYIIFGGVISMYTFPSDALTDVPEKN
jgi:hypothetical protein